LNADDEAVRAAPYANTFAMGNASTAFTDIWCANTITDGVYAGANCKSDDDQTGDKLASEGGNIADWTDVDVNTTSGEYCEEYWTEIDVTYVASAEVVITHMRCVRAKASAKRKFKTGDNGTLIDTAVATDPTTGLSVAWDMDWDYRSYSVTAGWTTVEGATDAPSAQNFAA